MVTLPGREVLLIMKNKLLCLITLFILFTSVHAQNKNDLSVIAYYAEDGSDIDSFRIEQLTHIIYSFCHLKGNRLNVDNATDSAVIRKLVALKKKSPGLKVLLSLGGWGGCETCSPVFASAANRKVFASSVKELCTYFGTDGIDLDWEYPAISGYPGHAYDASDKSHFTGLVDELRSTLGKNYEISFAAGGFNEFIEKSIDWNNVMKKVDRVNIMTYDLVNGYSKTTGHHTALFSTGSQHESTDNAVKKLLALGIPANKLVIGAAFYGRVWEKVPAAANGLYQSGNFLQGIGFRSFDSRLSADSGFIYHWDETAKAPFIYHPARQWFVTYDDRRSIELKTKYAIEKGLGGIMFWDLGSDSYHNGLLHTIYTTKRRK